MAAPVAPAPVTPPAAGTNTAAEVATKVTTTRVQQEDPPIDPMPSPGVVLLTLYFLLLGGICVNVLTNVWPPPKPAPAVVANPAESGTAPTAGESTPNAVETSETGPPPAARDSVVLLGGLIRADFAGRDELRLILIALFAGGLGTLVSSGLSFASYLGSRRLDRWWTVWYLLRPPTGMALALLTYFLLRAGLLTPGAGVNEVVSPYGVAAIAGLMGMFIKEATDKLKDVATALFKSRENEQRAQPLQGEKQTEVTKTGVAAAATPPATGVSTTITTTSGVPGTTAAPPAGHQYDPGA